MPLQPASTAGSMVRLLFDGLLFVAVPAVVLLTFLLDAHHDGNLGIDLEQTLLPAARTIADGGSPYPGYGYPPLVAFALVPLTLVPGPDIVFTGILAACVPASLWFLGVRDWRCYGVVFLWAPILSAVQTGNVTLLLLLGSAICWHARDRWRVAAVAGGLAVAAKILCWPIAVWLAATRRVAAAVGVAAVAGVVTFVLWGTLGFSGLVDYPSNLGTLGQNVSSESYTLKVMVEDIGLGAGVARLAWAAGALAVLAATVVLGRRGDDRRSFALAVTAMVVASPIVWMHSFALLLAPVAIMRPRLSAAWLVPVLMVIGTGTGNGTPWQTAGVLGLAVLTVGLALVSLPRQRGGPTPAPAGPVTTIAR